jgi:hypothetical protein
MVPYDMEQQRKESREFLDDLVTRDQRMMFAVVTLVHTADTLEQLNSDTEAIKTTARKHLCSMTTCKFQQLDGLNTALPIGTRKINALRTLTIESLAVLMPFRVQEIMDTGSSPRFDPKANRPASQGGIHILDTRKHPARLQ